QASEEPWARLRGIVLVIRAQRSGDAIAVEKLAGDAGILACDQVGGGENLERAHGHVAQIADRSGDEIKPGGQRRRGGGAAVENIGRAGGVFDRAWARGGGCGRPHLGYFFGGAPPPHWRR